MSWPINNTVKLVLGIAGNITALGLFLSPAVTFHRIVKNRSTEDFSGLPYVITVLNCSLWTFYGLPIVSDGQILVSTVNGVGTLLEAIYVSLFLYFATSRSRIYASLQLSAVLSFLAVILTLSLLVRHGTDQRSQFVGIVADVVTVMMYASPLSIMHTVITTKSVEYMPLTLSLNVFSNALAWTAYAAYVRDVYVLIPNALGLLLAISQLIVYARYSRAGLKAKSESRQQLVDFSGEDTF